MKVFISYENRAEPLVQRVAAALEEAGLEVWDAARQILPGDNFAGKIAQALQESEAMVVLITPEALRSKWIRWEVDYALGEQGYARRLIPVLVGDPEELPMENVPWILRRLPMLRLDESPEEEEIKRIAQALLEVA